MIKPVGQSWRCAGKTCLRPGHRRSVLVDDLHQFRWVGVRRGNHAGPLALYVRPQAEAGLLGIAAAVGSANHVPPYGGTDLLLGTNPIAVSAPADGADPFVFDIATTVAAMGKIKTLLQQGEPMPEGWMVARIIHDEI